MHADQARQRFAELAARPEEAIDVAEGALLIAAEAYPDLDVDSYLLRLERLAESARPLVEAVRNGDEAIARLNDFLFVHEGFTGNRESYYDRRNSFLNEVLERRTGIPITLSLVYTEVGRRLGFRVHGVGFPGHFLVRCAGNEDDIIVDPFFGSILSRAQCEERLRSAMGAAARLESHHLRAARPKEMLARMLNNLKFIELREKELAAALSCSERILLLEPDNAHELRDRGLLYAQLDCFTAARSDLERFLELEPEDPTAGRIREHLIEIRRRVSLLH
jgi:regulator of sirC expression with transglutaminase-like and TPR domain